VIGTFQYQEQNMLRIPMTSTTTLTLTLGQAVRCMPSLLLCVLLAACGGGGSSASAGAQPVAPAASGANATSTGTTTGTTPTAVGGVSETTTPQGSPNSTNTTTPATPPSTQNGPGTAGSTPPSPPSLPASPASPALPSAGLTARFNFPVGITSDSAGNLYVADRNNSTIRKITQTGVVTTLAGAPLQTGNVDATGSAARFNLPSGVAADRAGTVYVADTANHTIRRISPAGAVTTIAGAAMNNGSNDGEGTAARFNSPSSVAVDGAGNLYVADTLNYAVRRITPTGSVSTIAGKLGVPGYVDGPGTEAQFIKPEGITVDNAGNVYVTDTDFFPSCHLCTRTNSTIRKITPAGVVSTLAGIPLTIGSADGPGNAASFSYPAGLTVDGSGTLYVADTNNFTIRKVTAAGVVSTFAGTPKAEGSVDGTGTAARFAYPKGITLDPSGNLFVTEAFTVRKITPSAVVTTFAGRSQSSGSEDSTQ
jgi:sugar lactone lactonase YvrE